MAETEANTAHKTFEYKIRPHKKFIAACEVELEHARQIYNAALQERLDCYKVTGKTLGWVEQSRHLTDARTLAEVKAHLRTIQSDSLERADEAFKGFFRRCKNGETPGFPRFKGKERYHTFSQQYEKQRPCPLKGDKLNVPGVGSCRVRLSRPIEGRCVQLRITRRADGWYALLVCEVAQPEPLPFTGAIVGIDVGIENFATLSNGEQIANPRPLEQAQKTLTKLQRRLSRKKRGSRNRQKAKRKVALAHLQVVRCRKHFHYETAARLVKKFDVIVVEDLNVKGLAGGMLARQVHDVAWGSFFQILTYKAESAGRLVVKVDPAYTSQDCSGCGARQKKQLAERAHACLECGLVLHRDHNAAVNILLRASGPEVKPVECDGARRSRNVPVGADRTERNPSGIKRGVSARARH